MRRWLALALVLSIGCASTTPSTPSPSADADVEEDASAEEDASGPELDGAAQSGDAAPADDAATADASDDGGSRASYAVKTVIDVWWQDDIDPPSIDSARGLITLFHKLSLVEACEDGEVQQVELEPCGIELPPLVAWAGCAAHQIEAPASLWSSSAARAWSTAGVLERDGQASVPLELGNIGTAYHSTGCGVGGMSAVSFQGLPPFTTYTAICDFSADCPTAVELVGRVQASLSDWSDACASDGVSVTTDLGVTSIGLSIEACELTDGRACSAEERDFVDALMPGYRILDQGTAPPPEPLASPCDCPGGCGGEPCPLDQTPSLGTRSAIVRLSDEGAELDCEAARNAVDTAYPGTAF